MKIYKTVSEIAKEFNVTEMGVRVWLKKGLQYKTEKVIGIKPRTVICSDDVKDFLKQGIK